MSEIVESQYEREQRLKSEQREREDTRQTPPPNNDPQLEREERLNQGVPKFRDTHGNVVSEPVVAVTPPLPAKVIDPKKVKPKQLKVRALNTGQYKGRMYNHGDVFYVDEGYSLMPIMAIRTWRALDGWKKLTATTLISLSLSSRRTRRQSKRPSGSIPRKLRKKPKDVSELKTRKE